MKWWNEATDTVRAYWLKRAGSAVPADAGARSKRKHRVQPGWCNATSVATAMRLRMKTSPGFPKRS